MKQREIKFRVWVGSETLMIYPNKNFPIYIDNGVWNDGEIPMQYTGLNDRNGKEIYEGDVLRSDFGLNEVIEWVEMGCCNTIGTGYSFDQECCDNVFIAGNVYENPELLK